MADIEVSVETEEQFWDGQSTPPPPNSHARVRAAVIASTWQARGADG